jgi:hypothetical protein
MVRGIGLRTGLVEAYKADIMVGCRFLVVGTAVTEKFRIGIKLNVNF